MRTLNALAVILLLGSLVACGTGPQPTERSADRKLELLRSSARKAYESGEAPTAVRLYEQALERARLRADDEAIAAMSLNLAAAQARKRDYPSALNTLRTADRAAPPGTRFRRRLLAAQILFEQGRLNEAERALDEAGIAGGVSLAYRGLIAAERSDLTAARDALNRLDGNAPSGPRARLAGKIAELEGDHPAAARAFQREADAARRRGNYAATAEALARAGEAHAKAGHRSKAARLLFLAGRSGEAQETGLPYERWLDRAQSLSANAEPPESDPPN